MIMKFKRVCRKCETHKPMEDFPPRQQINAPFCKACVEEYKKTIPEEKIKRAPRKKPTVFPQTCRKCGVPKAKEFFYPSNKNPDIYLTICKYCHRHETEKNGKARMARPDADELSFYINAIVRR